MRGAAALHDGITPVPSRALLNKTLSTQRCCANDSISLLITEIQRYESDKSRKRLYRAAHSPSITKYYFTT
jgi:hypothetical protein